MGSLYIHAFPVARDTQQLIGGHAQVVGGRVTADGMYVTLDQLWDLIEKLLEQKGIDFTKTR